MGISPAIIAALIGAATTATTTGLSLSGAFQPGSSGPNAQQLQLQNMENQQKTQQQQEQQAFRHFAPDAQAQTGGALDPASFSSMVSELSGAPADINLAQQTLFGNTPGLSGTSSGTGLAS